MQLMRGRFSKTAVLHMRKGFEPLILIEAEPWGLITWKMYQRKQQPPKSHLFYKIYIFIFS